MHILQIRNATVLLQSGPYRILVDPMLAARATLPPLRVLAARERNPLVDLPRGSAEQLEQVTHCLITHCQRGHFDHLDRAGTRWLRAQQTPVICTAHDAPYLQRRGLNVQPLPATHEQETAAFLGGRLRTVRCTHGRGWVGRLMEHGVGYFIELPGEPSLYLAGDTVLTPRIRAFVQQFQPDLSIIPAGGAHFDIGGDIIMGISEAMEFTRLSKGRVIANHLQAISHCPVTRAQLAAAARSAGLAQRLFIPQDGEWLQFPLHGEAEPLSA